MRCITDVNTKKKEHNGTNERANQIKGNWKMIIVVTRIIYLVRPTNRVSFSLSFSIALSRTYKWRYTKPIFINKILLLCSNRLCGQIIKHIYTRTHTIATGNIDMKKKRRVYREHTEEERTYVRRSWPKFCCTAIHKYFLIGRRSQEFIYK